MDRLPPAHPVVFEELLLGDRYEAVREERAAAGRAARARRRVAVGPHVSILFENHDTVLHQLHEILRAEKTTDPALIEHELEAYNEMVAPAGHLSATLFVEYKDLSTIREELDRMLGIEHSTYLVFPDGSRCRASYDPYTQEEFKLSAVQYLLFSLDEAQQAQLRSGEGRFRLAIEQSHYDHSAALSDELVRALGSEL